MKKKTIFQSQSQEILMLFEKARDRSKVMCVPIDYAKKEHVAMFCDGNGKIIRKPFPVENSLEGKHFLIKQVTKSCRHHGIHINNAFFGGEDCGSYADNFIASLRSEGWLVAGVNACDAKKQRENLQASTDRIDLLGISKMLLNCRGNCSPAQSGVYWNLRMLVRQRRKLVHMATGVRHRIHNIVDRIFPGFLNERKSGVPPFSKCSLKLMKDKFSTHQISRRHRSTLTKMISGYAIQQPDLRAKRLQEFAGQVLNPPHHRLASLQLSLRQQVKLLICIQESIQHLEREIAENLAKTPGAFLTSIRGIGIVLAAGVSAEIGDPAKQGSINNLVSYAGIVPRVKQTGGTQGKTYVQKVGKRCNRILKDYVVQSAVHIGLQGPDDLKVDYKRRDAQGQHADFGIARRYLRLAMSLMRNSQTYLPRYLRSKQVPMKERAEYYSKIWPKIHEKWRKAKTAEIAFDKAMPLGQWRNMIEGIYGIELSL